MRIVDYTFKYSKVITLLLLMLWGQTSVKLWFSPAFSSKRTLEMCNMAKIICSEAFIKHRMLITPVLVSLLRLPVTFTTDFNILLLMYEALHGQASVYLKELTFGRTDLQSCSKVKVLLFPDSGAASHKGRAQKHFTTYLFSLAVL